MDLKTAPLCECDNGFMVLREAGPHSTRPSHYYFICPTDLKHRNRFFWYDEYQKVTSSNEPSSKNEMGSNSSQNPTSPFVKRRNTEGYNASCTSQSYNLKHVDIVDTEQHVQTKSVMASNTSAPSNDPVDHKPLSVEQVCCCFGCICSILCLMMFLMLVLVISK